MMRFLLRIPVHGPFPSTRAVIAARARGFLASTRAGATAIAAAAVVVMTVGAAALITDHVWLYDQRDVLKTAAEAASIAVNLDMERQLAANPGMTDAALETALEPLAKRYVEINLAHLPPARLQRAKDTLDEDGGVEVDVDRAQRTARVTVEADLGGTLFSRALPLLGRYAGPDKAAAQAGVQSASVPAEVVLAIDVSSSMRRGIDPDPAVQSDSRIDIVKDAAKDLVDIISPNSRNRVAVGLVPWNVIVRLDATTAGEWTRQRWARYPARRTYPVPYTCWGGACTVPATSVVDTLPASPPASWERCLDGDRIVGGTARIPARTAQGLLDPPSTTPFPQSFFRPRPASSYRCFAPGDLPPNARHACLRSSRSQGSCAGTGGILNRPAIPDMLALSTDATAIEAAIDAMDAADGRTYSALGVLWAQRMLEPAWRSAWGGTARVHPADPATPEYAGMRKAIVLLTDGEDTYCENNTPGCSSSTLAVSRAEACTLAKAQGTEIFVIAAYASSTTAEEQSLRDCSSEAERPGGRYVFLNNATRAALEAAFADIANQLRHLRRIS